MFIEEDDLLDRLRSPENLINRLEVHRLNGNKKGTVPIEVKKLVCALAQDSPEQDIANAFDISQEAVSVYKNGNTSHSIVRDRNPELKAIRDKVKLRQATIEDKALEALLESVEILKPQLAEIRKPKVLSSIAKDLSFIAKNTRSESENEVQNRNVHLHI